ncbi:MAG: hypothetical protein U9N76_00255, partial [Candidatus Marinimicrobia bacterium]|nr:hypothetical protein [Candidatus Neomarinimicrobiota bacterium]
MEKNTTIRTLNTIRFAIAIIAFLSIIIEYGFYININTIKVLHNINIFIATIFILSFLYKMYISENIFKYMRLHFIEFSIFIIFLISIIIETYFHLSSDYSFISKNSAINYIKLYFIIIQIFVIFNASLSMVKSKNKWLFFSLHPSHIIIYSFFIVILIGTFLLKLPKMTNEYLQWSDAIFISTSAVCVTGLTPLIVSETFTISGQVII